VVVGVTAVVAEERAGFVPFAIDPGVEAAQAEGVAAVRARRDRDRAARALDALEADARAGRNVVPACIEAAEARCTIGETVGRLAAVHGRWTASRA
ncbi:MAG: methylmalonyl-CoA mutase family protein, partial [Actinomycetota bacterium]